MKNLTIFAFTLTLFTSAISTACPYQSMAEIDKNVLRKTLSEAEKETENKDISDQAKYLLDQKIDVLKSLNLN